MFDSKKAVLRVNGVEVFVLGVVCALFVFLTFPPRVGEPGPLSALFTLTPEPPLNLLLGGEGRVAGRRETAASLRHPLRVRCVGTPFNSPS